MTEQVFERVAQRVHSLAGIVLEPHKREMIRSRLGRRLKATNIESFEEYIDHVDRGTDAKETQAFLNALTTNLTSFFREAHHFVHLRDKVLSDSMASGNTRLRFWSAGCSSGEEAYTIALTILDKFGAMPADARILATDLDTNMLETGRAGVYQADRCKSMESNYARLINKMPDGRVKMPDAARNAISFRHLNLLERWPVKGPFDAIFCRNVMIYFGAETKTQLISRFADLLRPGGCLYLGHSESILERHPRLTSLGDTIYINDGGV